MDINSVNESSGLELSEAFALHQYIGDIMPSASSVVDTPTIEIQPQIGMDAILLEWNLFAKISRKTLEIQTSNHEEGHPTLLTNGNRVILKDGSLKYLLAAHYTLSGDKYWTLVTRERDSERHVDILIPGSSRSSVKVEIEDIENILIRGNLLEINRFCLNIIKQLPSATNRSTELNRIRDSLSTIDLNVSLQHVHPPLRKTAALVIKLTQLLIDLTIKAFQVMHNHTKLSAHHQSNQTILNLTNTLHKVINQERSLQLNNINNIDSSSQAIRVVQSVQELISQIEHSSTLCQNIQNQIETYKPKRRRWAILTGIVGGIGLITTLMLKSNSEFISAKDLPPESPPIIKWFYDPRKDELEKRIKDVTGFSQHLDSKENLKGISKAASSITVNKMGRVVEHSNWVPKSASAIMGGILLTETARYFMAERVLEEQQDSLQKLTESFDNLLQSLRTIS